MVQTLKIEIPNEIKNVAKSFENKGFSLYLIGGCVRDLLMGRVPSDWDATGSAIPAQIEELFPHTFCNNKFGTVTVLFDDNPDIPMIEITPFRKETKYSDSRRPDFVDFDATLEEDLSRRDFTIGAIALNPLTKEIIDPCGGMDDLKKKIVKTVGEAKERFLEDNLRLLRAVRIATTLSFEIEEKTKKSITELSAEIKSVAQERVRDEFSKILMSKNPMAGMLLMKELGLLKHIVPELEIGIGVEQNQAHSYDVFEHNLRVLQHSADKDLDLPLRLSAIFHDVAKPHAREWSKKNKDWSFHGHEIVGAKLTNDILTRLKYPKEVIKEVRKLVRWHMFFSDTEEISLSGVRRMIARVGESRMWRLIDLRMCDRIGTGRPKENPYRLRKYASMMEEVLREPITPGNIAISGVDVMKETSEKPSPRIGNILKILLAETLLDPSVNNREHLISRAKELSKEKDDALRSLGETGKNKIDTAEQKDLEDIRKKYGVK